MFGIGSSELLIIMGLCVLIFGARKIPELGRGLGTGIREFRQGLRDVQKEEDEVQEKIEQTKES